LKKLLILVTVILAGCATQPYQPKGMSYAEVERIRVTDADCKRIDYIIGQMEEQLRIKGYAGKNPEDLPTEEDRKYNSRAKVVIWSLRIGCNNPDRYK
jgi:hypothetical protein